LGQDEKRRGSPAAFTVSAAHPTPLPWEHLLMLAPTEDTIVLARQRYSAGAAVSKILGETGMSLGTLYLWLDGGPKDAAGRRRFPAIPRRRIVMGKRGKPLSGGRVSLVNRLWRTAERQVRDVESRMCVEQEPEQRERDARMLSVLVKTVRELRTLHTAEEKDSQDEYEPDNLDDFRRELARKIDGIIAERNDKAPREDETGRA
jgi:hypothetical protein